MTNSILASLRDSNEPLLVSWPSGSVEAAAPIRHILVPLGGSKLAEGALDSVVDVARATGARITLAHVVAMPTNRGPGSTTPARGKPRAEPASAEAYLESMAAPLREAGLDVDTRVAEGETPAKTLSELADAVSADLIVMAAHGHLRPGRALLGSVSEELLRVSSLPVLITLTAAAAPEK